MKVIYVTGISGFVGLNLFRSLKNKFDFIGISRSPAGNDNCISYEDYFLTENSEDYGIVHLAGKAHDLKKVSVEKEYFDANYSLTKKLYDKFLSEDCCKCFIFMSSVKAVTDAVNGILFEDEAYNPTTAYGKSKMMAEKYIMDNLPSNKNVYILRPCMIHGPGNKGNLNLLFTLANKGVPYPLAAFENKRSFLSIDNLIFVIEKLLTSKVPSGVYNVADDEVFSTNEVIKLMGESLNKETMLIKVPRVCINLIGKLGDMIYLPLNSERLGKLTENFVVSNDKLKNALHSQLPISGKVGLLKTFKSFKNN
ncbi:NAD-dependent epimerase/dehydratase family protein [Aquiflexum sp.]|uniref:NAD-dependent epimerase/dehydratase family protein n=1 Tax=Aquiflexum sp. TaxID=1872584 RepID=UPI0035935C8E